MELDAIEELQELFSLDPVGSDGVKINKKLLSKYKELQPLDVKKLVIDQKFHLSKSLNTDAAGEKQLNPIVKNKALLRQHTNCIYSGQFDNIQG